jgi:signal peptidase II
VRVLLLSAAIVVVDQITKLLVKGVHLPSLGIEVQGLPYGASYPVIGDFFRITYIENPGMAFGIDLGSKMLFSILSIIAVIAIFVYLLRAGGESTAFRASLAVILGGAVGNLIDRTFYGVLYGTAPLFHGSVVDFFDVDFFNITLGSYRLHRWPVFNVADACVTVGVLLILFFHRAPARSAAAPNRDGTAPSPVSESSTDPGR